MASSNCTWVRPRCRRSSANRLPKSEGYAFLAITPAILSPLAPQPGRAVASISRVMYTLADGILAAREVTRNAFSLLTAFWRKRVLMIEQAEIDRVKQSTDLAALIRARRVTHKHKRKHWVGLSLAHRPQKPSLIVDPKKQLWNCLGSCSEGGDVYKWVMKSEGIGFREAHERLVLMSHTPAVEVEKGEVETPDFVASAADLIWLERATAHYHRRMLETPSAQDYLRSRGITAPEIVSAFRLGYADGTLLQVISAEGRGALKRIGLITESGRELLGGCVVFPLVDARNNELISLYGRYCGKEEKLYLPGAQHLYLPGPRRGVFNPQGARNADEVIVTESVIDACAAWSAGVRNVIPAYGTNGLTEEIITHLRECRVSRVALMLDADDAGEHAAKQMEQRLGEIEIAARSILLPVKDASEFIASGATADELRALIKPANEGALESENTPEIAFERQPDGALRAGCGEREYRIRGLSAVGLERMKINLRLSINGSFHLDTIDLYQARARAQFAQTAAKLCRVDEKQIGADLLALIEPLEAERLKLKKTSSDEAAPMTPQEREAALSFLRAPNLCERLVEDFKRCGLEGERTTVLVAYLAALSRKLPEPLGVLIVARSGAGKSALQDAVYSLRTLASDQHLAIAATRTAPQTGKLHTEHYEVHGPVSIIVTTTSPEAFDEETRSRFAPLTLDESVEHTRAILERQRRRYSLEGVLEQATAESVRRLHHNAQRLLRPLRVVNPFHGEMTYPEERLIHRREQKKYLSLINAIALLKQHQRETKRAANDEVEVEYIEVTPDDIALANELAEATLSR